MHAGVALEALVKVLEVSLGGGQLAFELKMFLLQIGLFLNEIGLFLEQIGLLDQEIGLLPEQFSGLLFFGLELKLHGLHFAFTFGRQRLLLPESGAGFGQFAHELLVALALLVEGQAHDGGEILPAIDLIGGQVEIGLPGALLVRNLIDINGRKGQQAHQEEVTNDNEYAAVQEGKARLGAPASVISGASASASSNRRRRAGRRWQILKMETKMMPKDVDE